VQEKQHAIAGRKTSKWRGEILVDGRPKVQSEFIKYAAYVEQFGCHVLTATVLDICHHRGGEESFSLEHASNFTTSL